MLAVSSSPRRNLRSLDTEKFLRIDVDHIDMASYAALGESRGLDHIYAVEETEFNSCLQSVGNRPIPNPEECWTAASSFIYTKAGEMMEFVSPAIGMGSTARAYLSKDASVVVKVLIYKAVSAAGLCKELAVMKSMQEAGVQEAVRVVDVDWSRSGRNPACQAIVLAMENGGHYALNQIQRSITEWSPILVKITSILENVHGAGYIHGDTNLGNFVYTNPNDIPGSLKLIDFGLASRLFDGPSVISSKHTGFLMTTQCRIKDLFVPFILTRTASWQYPSAVSDAALSTAISELRQLGDNPATRDQAPPYQEIINLISR